MLEGWMKFGRSLRGLSLAGLLLVPGALGACVQDGASIHVICPVVPEDEDGLCYYDPGGTCELSGAMNLASVAEYRVGLRIDSGLKARGSEVPPRAETNRVALTSAKVEIRRTNGAMLVMPGLKNPFEVVAAGTIPPGGSGIMSVGLIPAEYVAQLRENAQSEDPLGQIVLSVRVHGITDGDVEVESNEWSWPIRLVAMSNVEDDGQCSRMGPVCFPGINVAVAACEVCYDADGKRDNCEPE
jgi:hypothetical protein